MFWLVGLSLKSGKTHAFHFNPPAGGCEEDGSIEHGLQSLSEFESGAV